VLDVNGAGTGDGAKVIQWTSTGSVNQQWQLVPNADGSFRLTARHSGRLLRSPGSSQGEQLDQWSDTSSDNQWWKVVDAGGGYVNLVNVRNGLYVDVDGSSQTDGAKVIQWPANGKANQQWQIVWV
jgi:alpha-L-fucosidase 2